MAGMTVGFRISSGHGWYVVLLRRSTYDYSISGSIFLQMDFHRGKEPPANRVNEMLSKLRARPMQLGLPDNRLNLPTSRASNIGPLKRARYVSTRTPPSVFLKTP